MPGTPHALRSLSIPLLQWNIGIYSEASFHFIGTTRGARWVRPQPTLHDPMGPIKYRQDSIVGVLVSLLVCYQQLNRTRAWKDAQYRGAFRMCGIGFVGDSVQMSKDEAPWQCTSGTASLAQSDRTQRSDGKWNEESFLSSSYELWLPFLFYWTQGPHYT